MEPTDLESEFLEELGNLLVDYPDIAARFTVADPTAIEFRDPGDIRWGQVPGNGWVCMEWPATADDSGAQPTWPARAHGGG